MKKSNLLRTTFFTAFGLLSFICKSQQDTIYRSDYNSSHLFYDGRKVIYELNQNVTDTIIRYFVENDQLAMIAGTNSGKPNGLVKKFYPNGNLYELATYKDGLPIKTIKRYYNDGKIMGTYEVIPPLQKSDLGYDVEERVISYYDSLGNQTVIDGKGSASYINPLEREYETGEVINGLKNGLWTGSIDRNGFEYEETYSSGKFIEGNSRYEDGEEFHYTELSKDAEFDGGIDAYYMFLRKNLRYPKPARKLGIQGRVHIYFVAEKDGSLSNFKVLKGIGHGCDEEAIRVLNKSPKWIPGMKRGRVVKQAMMQDLLFKFAR